MEIGPQKSSSGQDRLGQDRLEQDRFEQDRLIDPEWTNVFGGEAAEKESLESIFSRISIFSMLGPRELQLLKRLVHIRRYRPGEVVVWAGVEQSGFYLIRSGALQVVRRQVGQEARVISTLRPYELVGEYALLDGRPRTSSVVVAQESELIGFFRPDLTDIMVTNPTLGCKIVLGLTAVMSHHLIEDYQMLINLGYPFDTPDLGDAVEGDETEK